MMNNRYVSICTLKVNDFSRCDIVQDQFTGRNCISKTVLLNSDPVYIHQFRMEIQVLSLIQHPFMPQIIDVYETKDSLVLIENKIPGISLNQWKQEHPVLKYLIRDYLLMQAMNRFEYLHSLDILYIDIKEENFMIHRNHLYLIDFNSCTYNHSSYVSFASYSNASPELKNTESKDRTSDIYAFGTFMKTFYFTNPFIIRTCLNKESKKRFSSFSSLKIAFIIRKFITILISIFLSAILLFVVNQRKEDILLQAYLKDPQNQILFLNAYEKDLKKQKGNQTEKIQMNLYQWIEKGFIKDCLKNSKISYYLMKQAILSQNDMYCQYFLENIPEDILNQYPETVSFMRQIKRLSASFAQKYLVYVYESKDIDLLSVYMSLLISSQIILDDCELLYKINCEIKEDQVEFEPCAIQYLQYCLFLISEDHPCPPIPGLYQKSDQFQIHQLIQYIERI